MDSAAGGGTEPLLRIYTESCSKESVAKLLESARKFALGRDFHPPSPPLPLYLPPSPSLGLSFLSPRPPPFGYVQPDSVRVPPVPPHLDLTKSLIPVPSPTPLAQGASVSNDRAVIGSAATKATGHRQRGQPPGRGTRK